MSYNKHTWATGNVVGAVDLNRMEQGIEDAGSGDILVVTTSGTDTITMDKTWQEIYDAFPNVIVAKSNQYYVGKGLIEVVYHEEMGDYGVVYGSNTYITNSSSGYPQYNTIV